MKSVLITGGAGFIGVNLSKTLLKKGYYVISLDNFITSSEKNISELKNNKNYKFILHDINDPLPDTFYSQLKNLNFIFHLACPTGVPNIDLLGEEMMQACSIGTRNVLNLARKYKSKFLLASSSEVYGDPLLRPQKEMYTGNVDPVGERSPYEEGKRFAEALVKLYVKKYAVKGRIVRIFNTYGSYMSASDTRVIPRFIYSIKHNKPMFIQGDGKQSRTFCYIDDLITGFLIIMDKGIDGEVYNLGSNYEISIHDLATLLSRISKKKLDFSYVVQPIHDHKQRLPSLEKITALGWHMKFSLEKGLKKTLLWYGL